MAATEVSGMDEAGEAIWNHVIEGLRTEYGFESEVYNEIKQLVEKFPGVLEVRKFLPSTVPEDLLEMPRPTSESHMEHAVVFQGGWYWKATLQGPDPPPVNPNCAPHMAGRGRGGSGLSRDKTLPRCGLTPLDLAVTNGCCYGCLMVEQLLGLGAKPSDRAFALAEYCGTLMAHEEELEAAKVRVNAKEAELEVAKKAKTQERKRAPKAAKRSETPKRKRARRS